MKSSRARSSGTLKNSRVYKQLKNRSADKRRAETHIRKPSEKEREVNRETGWRERERQAITTQRQTMSQGIREREGERERRNESEILWHQARES